MKDEGGKYKKLEAGYEVLERRSFGQWLVGHKGLAIVGAGVIVVGVFVIFLVLGYMMGGNDDSAIGTGDSGGTGNDVGRLDEQFSQDRAIYSQTISSGEVSECEEIENEIMSTQCKLDVAESTGNAEICDGEFNEGSSFHYSSAGSLVEMNARDYCWVVVSVGKGTENSCDMVVNSEAKSACLVGAGA
ncbi:hypothetical protein HOA55_02475 [archaeon]|jgi:hypothetical protein|nr:hypothetical protein [archaeon]MBT3577844.1 hypothetical protein [archaeon]MBT6820195.1 hypothetical protein [archaeon]MBT6955774.1 hypothetical protein [archaeon]MBT7025306.1 hypothetical protein [archaeon]